MADIQTNKPASVPSTAPTTPVKKDWLTMTKTERDAEKQRRLGLAIQAVKKGARPGVQFKIGDHTLTARPSGVTEKGSVSYNFPPVTINYEGQQLRINKFSVSLLASAEAEGSIDWDKLTQAE